MEDLAHKIEKMVCQKPGVKARQLATTLSIKPKEVNSILYGPLKDKVIQDEAFKWYPVGYDKEVGSQFKPKKTSNKVSHIRGHSPFQLNKSNESIEIIYNKAHPFFSKTYNDLDEKGQAAVDVVFSSLSNVMYTNYDQADFFEDMIEDWGVSLSRLLKES